MTRSASNMYIYRVVPEVVLVDGVDQPVYQLRPREAPPVHLPVGPGFIHFRIWGLFISGFGVWDLVFGVRGEGSGFQLRPREAPPVHLRGLGS